MSLALVFQKDGPEGGQEFILKEFEEHGILITRNDKVPHLALASASEELLEKEAERIDLLKTNKKGVFQIFQRVNAKEFKGYGSKTFFSSSERNLLLSNILEQVSRIIRNIYCIL